MYLDWLRDYCMSFKGATEEIQWEDHLLFKVGGKIFVIAAMDNAAENIMSIKSDPERFEELTEIEGVVPAPYLAKSKWIAVKKRNKLRNAELKELIKTSYELVYDKLPKRLKQSIAGNT
jgi:predicted DNA-binding protein (MmcQ/YjbR family)